MIDELIRWSAGPGVRGGGSVGLMGLISRAVHNGGGHMLGVAVLLLELIGDTPGELEAVSNMHQSKAEMVRQSDALIALPEVERTCVHLQTTGCFWWPATQQYVGEPLVSFQDDKTKIGAASSASARGFHLVATKATW